jgi:hypothetical protein
MTLRLIVADPGKWPELTRVAEGASDQNALHTYYATFNARAHRVLTWLTGFPGQPGKYVANELSRRDLGQLEEFAVEHAAREDVALALTLRLTGHSKLAKKLNWRRDERFDRLVARDISPSATTFLGQAGASRRSLAQARLQGMTTVLNWNIQHWAFATHEFETETRMNPQWADEGVFSFARFRPELVRAWTEELKLAQFILSPSSSVTASFVNQGYTAESIWTIPYGVNLRRFRWMTRAHSDDRPLHVLFVGQLSQRKGISYIFDAARRLPNYRFTCVGWRVGKFPEPPPANVSVHFSVPDLRPFLQAADVFLFPSLVDGFGLVVLEAMATGLPAVCSVNAGASDLVDEGVDGWVVNPRDLDGIVARLERVGDDSRLLQRMGQAARAKAEAYPWERWQRSVVEAMQRELAGL